MKIIKIIPPKKIIKTKIVIPGSKSYTNRALLLAVLSKSEVKIMHPLISEDTLAMIDCLKKLGIKIIQKENLIEVKNDISAVKNHLYNLNAQISGTTIRFILALSTIIPGIKILSGQKGLNKRPISDLVDGLRQLGAKIDYLKKEGFPPIKVSSSNLNPGTIKITGYISSQYISAILMIAPLVGDLTIEVTGEQISKPYIDMTIDIMKHFGVTVENENYGKYVIPGNQKYGIKKYLVEGDLSSAAYFLAIAALTKSTLTLRNINPDSKQADMEFLEILEKMGNKIILGRNEITILGKGIKAVIVNMVNCPDQIQTVAVLAVFAKGVTRISGIQSLRVKETDRVLALKKELKKMGIKTAATKNTLTIYGGNPRAAKIDTYGDHRMAMSFAIAGCKLSGMEIVDSDVVNKTFPNFWKILNSIGVKTYPTSKNIVLIGMRGSGKTIIAKMISEKLNKKFLELDEMLVKKMNMTIDQIVKKYGWDFFRKKESEIVKEVADEQDLVISTGGGVVTRPENITALKKNGMLIYLNASLETLLKRIGKKIGYDPKMPALTNQKNPKAEITYILNQREKLYRMAADQIIETDNLSPKQLANIIISQQGVI